MAGTHIAGKRAPNAPYSHRAPPHDVLHNSDDARGTCDSGSPSLYCCWILTGTGGLLDGNFLVVSVVDRWKWLQRSPIHIARRSRLSAGVWQRARRSHTDIWLVRLLQGIHWLISVGVFATVVLTEELVQYIRAFVRCLWHFFSQCGIVFISAQTQYNCYNCSGYYIL